MPRSCQPPEPFKGCATYRRYKYRWKMTPSCCSVLFSPTQHVDTDGDGFISRQELTAALAADIEDTHKLQSAVLEALQDADTNGDGLIDYTVSMGTHLDFCRACSVPEMLVL